MPFRRLQAACLRVVRHAAEALPPQAVPAVGGLLGRFVFDVVRVRRRITLENIARAYCRDERDPGVRRLARESYAHLGCLAIELLRFPRWARIPLDREIEFRGSEHLEQAARRGRGVIALTAHLGNYDYLASAIARLGYHTAVVIKPVRHPVVGPIWKRMREATGLGVLTNRGSMRALLRHLRAGGVLGFVLDQHAHRGDRVWTTFFGRPAATMRGAALLAARTGAAVVPIFIRRRADGRHVAEAAPAVPPSRGRDPAAQIARDTQRYTEIVEQTVRRVPAQWIWLHRRWKVRPDMPSEAPAAHSGGAASRRRDRTTSRGGSLRSTG